MKKKSLSDRLVYYFKARPSQKIASGDIQRLVTAKTSYTAANATRRLRELAEDGTLTVEYRKGHAFYCYEPSGERTVRQVVIEGGVAVEKFIKVTN